jgi:hypothetical protein
MGRSAHESLKKRGLSIDGSQVKLQVKGMDETRYLDQTQRYNIIPASLILVHLLMRGITRKQKDTIPDYGRKRMLVRLGQQRRSSHCQLTCTLGDHSGRRVASGDVGLNLKHDYFF